MPKTKSYSFEIWNKVLSKAKIMSSKSYKKSILESWKPAAKHSLLYFNIDSVKNSQKRVDFHFEVEFFFHFYFLQPGKSFCINVVAQIFDKLVLEVLVNPFQRLASIIIIVIAKPLFQISDFVNHWLAIKVLGGCHLVCPLFLFYLLLMNPLIFVYFDDRCVAHEYKSGINKNK